MPNAVNIIQSAKKVLETEANAILALRDKIDNKFVFACNLLVECKGKIIVTGIGKQGHIASKIAATLTSTGNPALFLHPGEASHGDIGIITKKDIVIAISNSGYTEEIIAILPTIKLLGIPIISITGNPKSILAKTANINLDASVNQEACPLGLAPTSSTTSTLALGDALSMSLIKIRKFTSKDFARSHPGGILGKRLLLRVDDIMRKGDAIPKVLKDVSIAQALLEITHKCLGMTVIIDNNEKLLGIFTDGDLRRTLDKSIDIHKVKISQVMTTRCKTITLGILATEVINIMENHNITSLVVIENNSPIGVVNMHDLLKSGLR